MNNSQTSALTPAAATNQSAPNTSVTTEILAPGRIENSLSSHSKPIISGNSEKLMLETTHTAVTGRPSVAIPSVRVTRQPELLKARPYGQIQTTRPSIPTKHLGIPQTPRFSTPISQQQRLLTLSNNPSTSHFENTPSIEFTSKCWITSRNVYTAFSTNATREINWNISNGRNTKTDWICRTN